MDDPCSRLKEGDRDTVRYVDNMGTVHVSWDCGSGLGLISGVDSWKKI